MKCLICGEKTNRSLLCPKHTGVDACLQYLTVHKCNSFKQKKGEPEGVCEPKSCTNTKQPGKSRR